MEKINRRRSLLLLAQIFGLGAAYSLLPGCQNPVAPSESAPAEILPEVADEELGKRIMPPWQPTTVKSFLEARFKQTAQFSWHEGQKAWYLTKLSSYPSHNYQFWVQTRPGAAWKFPLQAMQNVVFDARQQGLLIKRFNVVVWQYRPKFLELISTQ